MLSILARFKWFFMIIAVELFFYSRAQPENYELFFFGWGLLSFLLLINNIFRRSDRMPMLGAGANSSTRYAYMSTALVEEQFEEGKKKKFGGGIFDFVNLSYLILLVVNIIAYILIMPK
ncbi:hypothetical protein QE109_00130 [Fusibacter bizertensis]|uniref:DUF3899 domain-containing protein n=1 Tax=Fusibacter bizertensis TaxID=1488331 RepID=A0ABT6N7X8_9FIRM|nr:hypothetical protein [Fusibacter bizertensis]MDH8676526.1 hypothetical protein [Fusibacter bizertensis]